MAVKGHPLAWHTLAPEWLLDRPLDEVETALRGRIRREVGEFGGLIDTWDAINEVVIMPVFEAEDNAITPLARARGRIHLIRLAFEEVFPTGEHHDVRTLACKRFRDPQSHAARGAADNRCTAFESEVHALLPLQDADHVPDRRG